MIANYNRRQVKTLISRFKLLMATDHTVANICRQKGISRKTYYRRLDDYALGGLPGLMDRPRKLNNRSQKEMLHSEIRSIVRSDPKLGCRKISDRLKEAGIKRCFKTISNILREEGLNARQKRMRHCDAFERESEMYQ